MTKGTILTNAAEIDLLKGVLSETSSCELAIQKFQDATSETYEGVAQNLPKILDFIDNSNDEARALISYFISGDDSQVDSSVVIGALETTQADVVQVGTEIHQMFERDQQIFGRIKNQVKQLDELRSSIAEITIIADDIELLSYNSVFVASKAGAAGAPFSYIANEIKNLSNTTKSLALGMRNSSDTLVKNFEKFRDEIERIHLATSKELLNIDSHLSASFDGYTAGLKNMAELISQTLQRAENAKQNVPAIMVTLQAQDLLRQLLEKISYLNSEILAHAGNEMHWDALKDSDDLGVRKAEESSAHMIASTEMAAEIMICVQQNMQASVVEFDKLLRKMKTELKDIDQDRCTLVDFFAAPQKSLDSKSSIQMIFHECNQVLNNLFSFISSSVKEKRDVGHYGIELAESLKAIEINFHNMRDVIRRFSSIKVVSKMEIAREVELSNNMTASSEMFERLTENMEVQVFALRSQIENINQDVISALVQLDKNLLNQETSVRAIHEKIEASTGNLDTIKSNLNDAVNSVGKGSFELFSLIDQALVGIQAIRRIVAKSDMIQSSYSLILRKLRLNREALRQKFPDQFAQDSDYRRFEDLREICLKFSVYEDDVNEATNSIATAPDSSGDLVLF